MKPYIRTRERYPAPDASEQPRDPTREERIAAKRAEVERFGDQPKMQSFSLIVPANVVCECHNRRWPSVSAVASEFGLTKNCVYHRITAGNGIVGGHRMRLGTS